MITELPDIESAERLGRSVFSNRVARKAQRGSMDRNIFLEAPERTSISVDRMDHAPIEVMACLSRTRAQSRRTQSRKVEFQGWAILTVGNARLDGRAVEATPMPDNPFHADIFLNVAEEERRDSQKHHAQELAKHSRWLEAPS